MKDPVHGRMPTDDHDRLPSLVAASLTAAATDDEAAFDLVVLTTQELWGRTGPVRLAASLCAVLAHRGAVPQCRWAAEALRVLAAGEADLFTALVGRLDTNLFCTLMSLARTAAGGDRRSSPVPAAAGDDEQFAKSAFTVPAETSGTRPGVTVALVVEVAVPGSDGLAERLDETLGEAFPGRCASLVGMPSTERPEGDDSHLRVTEEADADPDWFDQWDAEEWVAVRVSLALTAKDNVDSCITEAVVWAARAV